MSVSGWQSAEMGYEASGGAFLYPGTLSSGIESELEWQGQATTFDAWENEDEITIAFGYSSGDILIYQYADEHVKLVAKGYLRGLVHVVLCKKERLAAVDLSKGTNFNTK